MNNAATVTVLATGSIFNVNFSFTDVSGSNYNLIYFKSWNTTTSSLFGGIVAKKIVFNKGGVINGSNTIDSLIFSSGQHYSFEGGRFQTINKYWSANSNSCTGLMEIYGFQTIGTTQADINLTATAVTNINAAIIKNIKINASAPLLATNSFDYGNNANINFTTFSGSKFYWVGGSGQWNDATHWSTINNGVYPSLAGCVPTPADDVEFNANSGFTSSSVKVFANNGNHFCKNMVWVGANFNQELIGTKITISGSLTLQLNMKYEVSATIFDAKQLGQTITCNGVAPKTDITFSGKNGGWTLQDELNVLLRSIKFENGFLTTNSQIVRAESFKGNAENISSVLSLSLGSSQIYLVNNWSYTGNTSNTILSAGTSHIFLGASFVGFINHIYNDISFTNPLMTGILKGNIEANHVKFAGQSAIEDNNTFNYLTYTQGSVNVLNSGATQTIKGNITAITPPCSGLSELKSNSATTKSKINLLASSTYNLSAVLIKNIEFEGVNVPISVNNCFDFGGNLGVIFNANVNRNFYWVGGTGNWNDSMHWSLINNGIFPSVNGCVPTPLDNVFFNNNSGFSTLGDTVKLNGLNHYCNNLTVQNTLNNPIFKTTNGGKLIMFGSLLLQNGIVWQVGDIDMNANTGTATINTNGVNLSSNVTIEGNANFELLSHLTLLHLSIISSKFKTNGYNIIGINFKATNASNLRTLNISNSVLTLESYTSNVITANALYATNSHIFTKIFDSAVNSFATIRDTFHNITILPSLGNVAPGQINGPFVANKVNLLTGCNIVGENTVDTLIFTPGKIYKLGMNNTQTINKAWYPNGNPCFITRISSLNAGSISKIKYKGVNKLFDYVYLKDISATDAQHQFATDSHSTDDGNNTFINFAPYDNSVGIKGFGNDTTINCTQFPNIINTTGFFANPNAMFTWQNGSNAQQYVAQDSGKYFVKVEYGEGCVVSDTIIVKRTNSPGLRYINAIICSNQNYVLPSGQMVNTSGMYSDTITNAIGCDSIINVNLVVNPAPLTNIYKRLCPGLNYTLPNGQVVNTSGIYTNLVPSLSGSCDSTVVTFLNVLTVDSLNVKISNDVAICVGSSVTLNASGGTNYAWTPANSLSNSSIANPIAMPNVTTIYTFNFKDTVCFQQHNLQTKVTVNPLPNVFIIKSNNIDCGNTFAQLSVANNLTNYIWSPNIGLNNTNSPNVIATPNQTTTYFVTAANPTTLCINKDSIVVEKHGSAFGFLVPNALTPNNDGANECFKIKLWEKVNNYNLSIYNRWGQMVFQTKNIVDCWNGTFNGKNVDGGAYIYNITAINACDNTAVKRKGTVIVIR